MTTFNIATRNSKLALWQAEWIQTQLQQIFTYYQVAVTPELLPMVSTGDIRLETQLAKIGGKGLFTYELEQAMRADQAQIAVHSLKDVPVETQAEFAYWYTARANEKDVVVFPDHSEYRRLEELPAGAVIGTSSVRRQSLLTSVYKEKNFQIKLLRGNVNTRLAKLNDINEGYAAIILAAAGLERLGLLAQLPHQLLSNRRWIHAPGQGIVAIQYKTASEYPQGVADLNNPVAEFISLVERGLAAKVGGSCSVPIGVSAKFFASAEAKEQDLTPSLIQAATPLSLNSQPRQVENLNPVLVVDFYLGDLSGSYLEQSFNFAVKGLFAQAEQAPLSLAADYRVQALQIVEQIYQSLDAEQLSQLKACIAQQIAKL